MKRWLSIIFWNTILLLSMELFPKTRHNDQLLGNSLALDMIASSLVIGVLIYTRRKDKDGD